MNKNNLIEYSITNDRVVPFAIITFLTLIPTIIYAIFTNNQYVLSIINFTILSLSIFGFLFMTREIVLFDPIVLFSVYYFTIVITGYYDIFTQYKYSPFINETLLRSNLSDLTFYASMYYVIGYLFTLLGYFTFKNACIPLEFKFDNRYHLSDTILYLIIIVFLLIGIFNFIFNINYFGEGNLINYLSNISVRRIEFSESGSTLGYVFAYTAMYFWFFKLLRQNHFWSFPFLIFIIITTLMVASTGRIFNTILYAASFIGIYYFIELGKNGRTSNVKYYTILTIFTFLGIVFYFLRLLSSLAYTENVLSTNDISTTISAFFSALAYFAIDLGNTPSIAVFLNIIDRWGDDIGFLYGQSLFTWMYNILPTSIRPEGYQPSVMIAKAWYDDVQFGGGSLPPTGIGEMYANFGFLGPIIGMFLFGALSAILYNSMVKSRSYWFLAIYIQIAIGFIMLYPKNEFDNLSFWYVLPIILTLYTARIITYFLKSLRRSEKSILSN